MENIKFIFSIPSESIKEKKRNLWAESEKFPKVDWKLMVHICVVTQWWTKHEVMVVRGWEGDMKAHLSHTIYEETKQKMCSTYSDTYIWQWPLKVLRHINHCNLTFLQLLWSTSNTLFLSPYSSMPTLFSLFQLSYYILLLH